MLGAIMTIFDTTVVNVAQRPLIDEFGASQAVVGWTMTGYMLALAAVIPFTGWAADRFGTKRLFIGSVSLFTVGSLACALADDIGELVAFRVLQGLGGGMIMPLMFTIIAREAGPGRLGRLSAVLGVPMLLGPIAGPILGGWLLDSYGWPSLFWINVPIGVTAAILAWLVFPVDIPSATERLDVVGALLLCPGLGTFLYGVSAIPERNTVADGHVLIPVALGLLLVAGFLVHAIFRASHPLIDLRLLRDRGVSAANTAMACFAVAFFGAALLLPSFLQQVLHQSPLQSGVHLIPQGLGAVLTMAVSGRIVDRRGPRAVVLAGALLYSAGMAMFAAGVSAQADYSPILAGALFLSGLGVGCLVAPLAAAAVQTLDPRSVARGSMLINVNQRAIGSIGTALTAMILTDRIRGSSVLSSPMQTHGFEYRELVAAELASAYGIVFLVTAGIAALIVLPALLLPKSPPAS